MSADEELLWAASDSDEVWAPIHAWRALGQLRAVEALPTLLEQFSLIDEDNECAGEELPAVLAMIGEPAIQGLKRFLRDKEKSLDVRLVVTEALAKVGSKNPETRDTCVAILETELTQFRRNVTRS